MIIFGANARHVQWENIIYQVHIHICVLCVCGTRERSSLNCVFNKIWYIHTHLQRFLTLMCAYKLNILRVCCCVRNLSFIILSTIYHCSLNDRTKLQWLQFMCSMYYLRVCFYCTSFDSFILFHPRSVCLHNDLCIFLFVFCFCTQFKNSIFKMQSYKANEFYILFVLL